MKKISFGGKWYQLTDSQLRIWHSTAGLPIGFQTHKRIALLHIWGFLKVSPWYARTHLWGAKYYQDMNARY